MLYGHLPPLRAVVVVLAVLIGAYGLEPGALTTVLLLIMYATARYAAVTGLAWFRFTRRRMRGITPVKLLDDTRMLAFQRVTLRICVPRENTLEVVDKTFIGGRYQTSVELGGAEVETKTRGGRKTYMLSGFASRDAASGAEMSTIRCRMRSRGDGWATVQERFVDPDDPDTLVERNILERPEEANVVVTRYFKKTGEDVETAYQKAMASVN